MLKKPNKESKKPLKPYRVGDFFPDNREPKKGCCKLLFVNDDKDIALLFTRYYGLLGYDADWSMIPEPNGEFAIFDWADIIFVPSNKVQVIINVRINPLGCQKPKKIFNLDLADINSEEDEGVLLSYVDGYFTKIEDIISKNTHLCNRVDDRQRTVSMLQMYVKMNPEFEPIYKRTIKTIDEIRKTADYYKKLDDDRPSQCDD